MAWLKPLRFLRQKPPLSVLFPAVEHWFNSRRGQLLMASEQAILDQLLNDCFGYDLLQLSVSRQAILYESARVRHKYRAYPLRGQGLNDKGKVEVYTDLQQLPFASQSIDVVIIHHSHEFTDNAQALLREVERITVNGGHVIILGFNPYSLMGLQTLITRYLPRSIWHNRFLSHWRINDWLSLLGFHVKQQRFGYHYLDKYKEADNALIKACCKYLFKLPIGGVYCLSAVKQVAAVTPDTPRWLKTPRGFSVLTPKANMRRENVVPIKPPIES